MPMSTKTRRLLGSGAAAIIVGIVAAVAVATWPRDRCQEPKPHESNPVFYEDFEGGQQRPSRNRFHTSGNSDSRVVVDDTSLSDVLLVSLSRLRSDVSYRTELVPNICGWARNGRHPPSDDVYAYEFRVLIPAEWEWDDDAVILSQWHGYPDFDLGENWRYPPLSLQIGRNSIDDEGNWLVYVFADSAQVTTNESIRFQETFDLGPAQVDMGKWTSWKFVIRWSPDQDGYLNVWKDDSLAVRYEGPTSYEDKFLPYWKFGVYVPTWKQEGNRDKVTEHLLYFDDIQIRAEAR